MCLEIVLSICKCKSYADSFMNLDVYFVYFYIEYKHTVYTKHTLNRTCAVCTKHTKISVKCYFCV